jgi:hypothetical protein
VDPQRAADRKRNSARKIQTKGNGDGQLPEADRKKYILDSDGTVIFTSGKLNGGSAITRKLSIHHGFACLHINLNQVDATEAPALVSSWIIANKIKILNVAGSRASKDPAVYELTRSILMSQHWPRKTGILSCCSAALGRLVIRHFRPPARPWAAGRFLRSL